MSHIEIDGHRIAVLFSESDISERIEAIAKAIAAKRPHRLLVVPVLKGSFVFAADLIRAMHRAGLSPEVDFMMLASYRDKTRSSGKVEVLRDVESPVADRDILLIDDILESGRTLTFARDLMLERGARHVSIAVLLDKHDKRSTALEADYVGFKCPDHFVVGYGMDVAYAFRELPFVGVVTGEA
jgi:hypoxanthine phosphoribosyltransferase